MREEDRADSDEANAHESSGSTFSSAPTPTRRGGYIPGRPHRALRHPSRPRVGAIALSVFCCALFFASYHAAGTTLAQGSQCPRAGPRVCSSLTNLAFNESGLPSGVNWTWEVLITNVSDNESVSNSSTNATLGFAVVSGTYDYLAANASAAGVYYEVSPETGSIVADGTNVTVNLTFQPITNLSFEEQGLPLEGTITTVCSGCVYPSVPTWPWSAWVDNSTGKVSLNNSSSAGTVGFRVSDGSYTFSISNASSNGSLYVPVPRAATISLGGGNVTEIIAFEPAYEIEFNLTGVPSGGGGENASSGNQSGVWNISLNGSATAYTANTSSANDSLALWAPNGSYIYQASTKTIDGTVYGPTTEFGALMVEGANVTQDVPLVPVSLSWFNESGLPAYAVWSARVFNSTTDQSWQASDSAGASSGSVSLELPNGAYSYSISNATFGDSAYSPSPATGAVRVSGHVATAEVEFDQLTNSSGGPDGAPKLDFEYVRVDEISGAAKLTVAADVTWKLVTCGVNCTASFSWNAYGSSVPLPVPTLGEDGLAWWANLTSPLTPDTRYNFTITMHGGPGPVQRSGTHSGSFQTAVGDVEISDLTVSTPSGTRSLVSWHVNAPANAVMAWGPSPDRNFSTAVVGNNTSGGSYWLYTTSVNYLDPNRTYDIRVSASFDSLREATRSSSWHTGPDPLTYFAGLVTNNSGGVDSSGNLLVQAVCAAAAPAGYSAVNAYTFTGDNGGYNFSGDYHSLPYYQEEGGGAEEPCNGYNVSLVNGPSSLTGTDYAWDGYFNETIITYAPQIINLVLPSNYISAFFPAVLDFSNDFVENESTISYTSSSSSSLTTTLSYSWSIAGGLGATGSLSGSVSNQSTFTTETSGTFPADGGPLDIIAQRHVSGTVLFDAYARSVAQTAMHFCGQFLNVRAYYQELNFTQPTDWMTPQNFSKDDLYYLNDGVGSPMDGRLVSYDPSGGTSGYGGAVQTLTANSSTGGYAVAVGLSASFLGFGSASVSYAASWSQTSSSTSGQQLSWSIIDPMGMQPFCVDVFGQGGSTAADADVIGIYTWPASQQDIERGSCLS